jgi:hypothetical protein
MSCGKASFPWLTKYAGPVSGTGRIGVIALAEATIDAAGQAAGLASKTAAVHAFCNVVNLDGNCLGRSTLTRAMFASSVCADDPDADPEVPEVLPVPDAEVPD